MEENQGTGKTKGGQGGIGLEAITTRVVALLQVGAVWMDCEATGSLTLSSGSADARVAKSTV